MNDATTMSPEQIAEAKAAEAAAKAKTKAEAAAVKAQAKADAAAKRATDKVEKDAKRKADAEAKKQAKVDAKAQAVASKEASKQPMQNDVRRPKPETVCGKCWATYDSLTNERGSPAAIADAKKVLEAQGINEATIRTQYAHWRKYNGVTGRVESTVAPAAPEAPTS